MSNIFDNKFIRSIGITCKGASLVTFAYQALFLVMACKKYASTNLASMAPSSETLSAIPLN
jgi:hypothetical protein